MKTPRGTAPKELTVLYDAGCQLCRSARGWLQRQPVYLPLRFVPAGTRAATRLYPALDPLATLREITVIDDAGRVYRGAKAWVICLWATRAHRERAIALSKPALWPLAKRFIAWLSTHRTGLAGVGSAVLGAGR